MPSFDQNDHAGEGIRSGGGKKPSRKRFRLRDLDSSQSVILGFLLLILTGALLLTLPISKAGAGHASFSDALFTSVSASCVTGLVVQDTGTYWSLFGQIVILALIQVGGLGIITMALTIILFSGKKIGLVLRNQMAESINAPYLSGILRLTRFILLFTAAVEGAGAAAMMTVFIPRYGVGRGIWYSVFHSVSAFCNAGFDILGAEQKFGSLTNFASQPVINITVMALIVIGGLGFVTWNDIFSCVGKGNKLRMQTKTVLTVTIILITVPALLFYFGEYGDLSGEERILGSLFQSVTTRTAGFNTTDLTKLSSADVLIFIILMLIGGSPGSTAGGMKTTTVAVLMAGALSVFRRKNDASLFHRRIPEETSQKASAILLMYLSFFSIAAIVISRIENLPILTCLFETASAIGTVGLTLGITPGLHLVSKILLMILMYSGRVGGLTLIYATVANAPNAGKDPMEKIMVG
ncbi:MAG: TrkH family potassium uptake protein [Bilifractor sp.]|jgi:trk system potassium uptake protein TrkH